MTEKDLGSSITVQLNLSLETIVGQEISYDLDGEVEFNRGVTLAHLVADKLADRLVEETHRVINYSSIRERVDSAINDAVKTKLADLLQREIVPTDGYGTRTGEPTTLSDELVKRALAWMKEAARDDFHRNRSGVTNMQKLADKAIGDRLEREITEVVVAAKAEALAKVKTAAAAAFAKQFAEVK